MPEITIILGPQGQIETQVPSGSFAGGKAAIEALLAALGQQMPLRNVSEVEAHRPEDAAEVEQQGVHTHPHLHGGTSYGH